MSLLVGHLAGVDMKLLPEPFQNATIEPDSGGIFPRSKVDQRQKIFFEAIKEIWSQV
jgi:hypothetical protein